ncbi:MAG: glycosyltransferase [Thermodesulfobacteriota bacterium]|nr:glycosyltransferase [Thermodesulfobacteriota bacterium]
MTLANDQKRWRVSLLPFLPFSIASAIMFLLCLKGGGVGFIGEHTFNLPAFHPGQPILTIPAGQFILLFSLTWLGCLILLLLHPRRLSAASSCTVILALAVIFRLALFSHEPSDDINRYLWEGRLINEGISPYHYAPNDPALAYLTENDPFHSRINHPDKSAAYPPFALGVFALIGGVRYSPLPMKGVIILFDLGTLWLLIMLLKYRGMSPLWSVLYAFNPVILYGFAGQAHFDSLQNFFLLGALYLYDKRKWGWMFLLAGLAVQSKYVAIITLPFFIRSDNWRYAWIVIATTLVFYLPFFITDSSHLFSSIIIFAERYAFNGSVHGLLRAALGGIAPATFISTMLLVAALIFGYRYFHPQWNPYFKHDPISGCFFSLGALLVLTPTIHFWYLSWIIPFLAVRPTMSWIILCLSISFYFVANGIAHHTGEWRLPVWAQVIEWLPFWLLLLYDAYLAWYRFRSPVNLQPPQTVSVVIPARNEEEQITASIDEALRDRAVCEVIVVDGGSSDTTVALAEQAGARVIQHIAPPEKGGGRGGQILAGIREAKGDVIAIVHADTHVTPPAFSGLLKMFAREPLVVGGAIGSLFDASGWRFRLLEAINDFRAVFLGITFGDQVQFFLRKPVVEKDLFPDIPLMEDVELSLRLSKVGRQVFLFGKALVSGRRWQVDGYSHFFLAIRLLLTYLWQRLWGKPESFMLYKRYYGDKLCPEQRC